MADMEQKGTGSVPTLLSLSLHAALAGDYWRVQRRQLAYLPEDVANELLAELLRQRRIEAPQLELFQHSATAVEADCSVGAGVGAGWLSYLGKFRCLHKLQLLRCAKLRSEHLAMLEPLAPTLNMLILAGCSALTAAGAPHLASLTGLQQLDLTDTNMGPPTSRSLSRLTNLTSLSLGGLLTTDDCLSALTRLTGLQQLVLWGSDLSDHCMWDLERLTALTELDISLTKCSAPPVLGTLRVLSMIHCQLDVVGEDRESVWLDKGATLPALEVLNLQSANFSDPRGTALLHQLVCGASGSLRELRLAGSNVPSLASMADMARLTYLDLAGTPIHDAMLGNLALLPLRHLSLADTGVTDNGIGQLLAMGSLVHLDLRNSPMGDGCMGVLLQLPLLDWLDLSGTEFTGNLSSKDLPGPLPSLTHLALSSTRITDRGCKLLSRLAPSLQSLQLGSIAVTDAGLRSLAKLASLTSLALDGCVVSDHGLGALSPLAKLRELRLDNCWLLSEGGCLAVLELGLPAVESLHLNGVDILGGQHGLGGPGPRQALGAGTTATHHRQRQRGQQHGRVANGTPKPAASRQSGSGDSSVAAGTAAGLDKSGGVIKPAAATAAPIAFRFGRVSEDLLPYDERIKYTRDELLELQQSGVHSCAEEGHRLGALLPPDLSRSSVWL
ncbi:hypothetical protein N2152v2_004122 [Parachlorella kessleri]